MKSKKLLAMLCAASLCCMSFTAVLPALAEDDAQVAAEEEAARKAAEEEAARQAAEEEAARKKAEEEAAAKRAAEEAAAKKAAEEEAARKKAEEEAAAKKAAEEAAAKKAAEEEAAKKAAEEEAAKKAAEEAAAKKAAEEEAAKKAAEEEAAKKAAEEEAAKKAAEEEAAKKAAEEEAAKKAAEEEAARKAAEEEAAKKAAEEEAARKAAEEEAAKKAAEEEAARKAAEEEAAEKAAEEEAARQAAEEEAARKAAEEEAAKKAAEEEAAKKAAEEEAAPAEAPVEEPTVEPTPEPTAIPLSLSRLKASSREAAPGSKLRFSFDVANADTVVWSAQRSDGAFSASGAAKNGAFSWKPEASGVYTVTVNATAGDLTASESCRVVVRKGALEASATANTDYAQQGGERLSYDIGVKGGCEPYDIRIVVECQGEKIFTANELIETVICPAKGYGDNTLTVTVTDALGNTASASAVIRSASNETNTPPALPVLSDDMNFAERLLAVAKSQQGYREVDENFIIRDDESVQGWSYYGSYYGMPYDEWCAYFANYCLDKAGIARDVLPRNGNCNRWKADLGDDYIDDEDDYIPEPGDIVFFHHARVSKDSNFPNHVGIVTDYDPENDIVYTVEGNSGKSVRACQYERVGGSIVGYASMRAFMERADEAYSADQADSEAEREQTGKSGVRLAK